MMKSTKEEMLAWMLDKVKNSSNPYEAESWLVTARTLGLNYDIDLCAYKLHCQHKNASSAAETIQRMYMHFPGEPRFWDEIMLIMEAVRNDTANDEVSLFRRATFQNLLSDFQQTILLDFVEKQKEKVEKCRLLLLLLRLFPDSAEMFGVQLIDVLTELEKNAQTTEPHENVYTQLLVCDVLPVLLRSPALKLSESACLEQLKRAIRYYLSVLSASQRRKQSASSGVGTASASNSPRAPRMKTSSRGSETPVSDYHHHQADNPPSGSRSSDNNWDSLLQCFSLIAERCKWSVGKKLKSFKLDHLRSTMSTLSGSSASKTEAIFTSLLIFLNLVFKFSQLVGISIMREGANIAVALVPPMLTESRLESTLKDTDGGTPAKVSKTAVYFSKEELASAALVPLSETDKTLSEIFSVGTMCLKLLDGTNRDELVEKLIPSEKRVWVKQFVRNSTLLSGDYRRMVKELEKPAGGGKDKPTVLISEKLQLAACYLALEKNTDSVKTLLDLVESAFSSGLRTGIILSFASEKWHFAFVSEAQLLSYTIRCVIYCLGKRLMEPTKFNDAMLGHSIVLSQYDWPKLYWLFTTMMGTIAAIPSQKKTRFTYPKLFSYIHRIEMLEEIAYLNANKATEFVLDITETETTRKIGASTRHSVKGQTDEVRSTLEAHASVSGSSTAPSLYEIFLVFLNEQKASLIELL